MSGIPEDECQVHMSRIYFWHHSFYFPLYLFYTEMMIEHYTPGNICILEF